MNKSRPESINETSDIKEKEFSSPESSSPVAPRTPEELLREYVEGDEKAFEDLFELIGGRLFNFICRFTGNPTRSEDVYQEVLIKVATSAHTFNGESRVQSWIFRIARNAAIDVARFEARRPAVSLERTTEGSAAEKIAGNESEPGEVAARRELVDKINLAVESLPDEQREAFLLKEEGGLTFDEMGRVMGCGRETAKSRVRYAIDRLRNALGKEARLYGL